MLLGITKMPITDLPADDLSISEEDSQFLNEYNCLHLKHLSVHMVVDSFMLLRNKIHLEF